MSNMAMARFQNLILTVQNEQPPTPEEFERYLALIRTAIADQGGDLSRVAGLNFTDGGSPTPSQRQQLKELFGGKNPRAAVITDSRVARGAAVIFSWFAPGFAAFAPGRWREAMAHVGLAESHAAEVVRCLTALKAEVGEVRAVGDVLGSSAGG